MKTILIAISAASFVFLSASCRTFVPIDPNTGVPSFSMMPDKGSSCCSKDGASCCAKVTAKPSK